MRVLKAENNERPQIIEVWNKYVLISQNCAEVMPRRCSISGCRSNYDTEKEHTSTFSLPKDVALRDQWLQKIPTDFKKIKNPVICVKHFNESVIIREDTVMVKGKLKTFQRERLKLKEDAVPTVFEDVRKRPSSSAAKIRRLEQERVENAVQQCTLDNKNTEDEEEKDASLEEILSFVKSKKAFENLVNWTCITRGGKLFLCLLDVDTGCPLISGYIVVNESLSFNVYSGSVKVSSGKLPDEITKSVNLLEELMKFVEVLQRR